jgi:hypothetical protein
VTIRETIYNRFKWQISPPIFACPPPLVTLTVAHCMRRAPTSRPTAKASISQVFGQSYTFCNVKARRLETLVSLRNRPCAQPSCRGIARCCCYSCCCCCCCCCFCWEEKEEEEKEGSSERRLLSPGEAQKRARKRKRRGKDYIQVIRPLLNFRRETIRLNHLTPRETRSFAAIVIGLRVRICV